MSGVMELVKRDDGIWLHLKAPSGKQAAINLTADRQPGIVLAVLEELATR